MTKSYTIPIQYTAPASQGFFVFDVEMKVPFFVKSVRVLNPYYHVSGSGWWFYPMCSLFDECCQKGAFTIIGWDGRGPWYPSVYPINKYVNGTYHINVGFDNEGRLKEAHANNTMAFQLQFIG